MIVGSLQLRVHFLYYLLGDDTIDDFGAGPSNSDDNADNLPSGEIFGYLHEQTFLSPNKLKTPFSSFCMLQKVN